MQEHVLLPKAALKLLDSAEDTMGQGFFGRFGVLDSSEQVERKPTTPIPITPTCTESGCLPAVRYTLLSHSFAHREERACAWTNGKAE